MNTSIHIPQELSDRLQLYLQYNKVPKNRFIVEAIEKLLDERETGLGWHPDILNWQGIPEFELETDRDFCLPSREEIF
jgi:hypothetical protein